MLEKIRAGEVMVVPDLGAAHAPVEPMTAM
jgi:hypothetical protein